MTSHVMSTWQIPRNSQISRTRPDCWRVVLKALLVSPLEHIVQRLRGFQTSLSFASRENGDLLRSRTLPRIEHPEMSGRQWDFCFKSLFAGSETSEIGRVSARQKGLNALGNHLKIYIYIFFLLAPPKAYPLSGCMCRDVDQKCINFPPNHTLRCQYSYCADPRVARGAALPIRDA